MQFIFKYAIFLNPNHVGNFIGDAGQTFLCLLFLEVFRYYLQMPKLRTTWVARWRVLKVGVSLLSPKAGPWARLGGGMKNVWGAFLTQKPDQNHPCGMKYKMYKQYFSCFSTSPLTRQHNLIKPPPSPTHHSWRKPCYLNRNMVWFIKYITSLITSVLEQVSGAPWHRHSTYCICPPTAHAWHTEG